MVTHTQVWGQEALWLTGEHNLFVQVDGAEAVVPVRGNILIWEYQGLTYRLESASALNEALALAEAMPH